MKFRIRTRKNSNILFGLCRQALITHFGYHPLHINPQVLACIWALLLLLALPIAAQDKSIEHRKVTRASIQDFHCTFWSRDYLTIDGTSNPDATTLYIPDQILVNGHAFNVAEIGASAFRDMKHLERCSFLAGKVLVNAFTGCRALRTIESRNPVPPSVGEHMFYYGKPNEVFDDYHFLTTAVVVPAGSEQVYREAHGWREFHTIVSHEPTFADYDHSSIRHRIAALEHERDSLTALEQQLMRDIAALRSDAPTVPAASTAPTPPQSPPVAHAEPFPDLITEMSEYVAMKVVSDGIEYKTRFSPDIIVTCHIDTTALRITIPDSMLISNRSYAVTQMWESAFASHGHLLAISLPAGLTNVAPGAFAGCRELRLLELRSAVPPVFRSLDNGTCAASAVFDHQQFTRVTLAVPPGSEQAYRSAPGWSQFAHIVTDRPTLAMLGVTPAHEQQLELDAHLCRIAARKGYIGTALSALRQALNQADRP